MKQTKQTKQNKQSKEESQCSDKFCPFHGKKSLKLRGRTFVGTVIRKAPGRITIQFERMLKVRKYERYEKRRTKLHARVTECLQNKMNIGDLIEISETRPISKTIHFVATKLIKEKGK